MLMGATESLLSSSVSICVSGGPKCQRCEGDPGSPHSQNVDFFKCAEQIVFVGNLPIGDAVFRALSSTAPPHAKEL
jgi:hypothetical protein